MISLRRCFSLWLCALASAIACDRVTSPNSLQPSFDKVTAGAAVDARVLVNNEGVGTIELRSGTFDPLHGGQTPNGYIQQAQYRVYDLRFKNPKQVLNRTVSVDPRDTILAFFSEQVPVDNGNTRVDPDPNTQGKQTHDPDNDGAFVFNPAPSGCHSDVWQVVVTVHLKGVASNPKADVQVSDTAAFVCPGPDITTAPSAKGIQVGGGLTINNLIFAGPGAQTDVQTGVLTYYEVGVQNTGPGGNSSIPANVGCRVSAFKNVGGSWVPDPSPGATPLFRWVGADGSGSSSVFSQTSSLYPLPPNGTVFCQFALALTGAGTRDSIVVTATSDEPDYDSSNNSVSTVFNLVDHAVIPPPPEGTPVGRGMEDAYYLGPSLSNPGPFLGLGLQKTDLDNLTSLIIGRRLDPSSTATFALRIQMWTASKKADGSVDTTTKVRMADVTWSANVSDLAMLPDGGCLGSPIGVPTTPGGAPAVNGATTTAGLCITLLDASATGTGQPGVKLAVVYHWNTTPPSYAGPQLVRYLDYLRFHADISFSDPTISGPLGGTANMALTSGSPDFNADNVQFNPSLFTPPIAFPTPAVTVTPATVQNSPTAYTYTVLAIAVGSDGSGHPFSLPSSATVPTDLSSLSATNCNNVTWAPVTGVSEYQVYRVQGGQLSELFDGPGTSFCDRGAPPLFIGSATLLPSTITPFIKVHKNQR